MIFLLLFTAYYLVGVSCLSFLFSRVEDVNLMMLTMILLFMWFIWPVVIVIEFINWDAIIIKQRGDY